VAYFSTGKVTDQLIIVRITGDTGVTISAFITAIDTRQAFVRFLFGFTPLIRSAFNVTNPFPKIMVIITFKTFGAIFIAKNTAYVKFFAKLA
jgi:hypothetical protein